MRQAFFLLIIFSTIKLHSQSLDQSFLDSLPEDVKNDVLENYNENSQLEKKVYRSTENDTELEKKSYEQDTEEFITDDIFGSDFFNTFQSTFMPVNFPNIDSSYMLDFGDILEIQLVGQKDSIETYPLNREGAINLPDIGKLYIAGMTLDEANSLIKARIKDAYIATTAYISLINIRDINVLIAGDAFNPGVYTLNGNSNILHAINAAGGINQYGSYRSIKLIRDNQILETLDIYDILIEGKYKITQRLRSGDIVFVEPRKKTVNIDGALKRPGNYEIIESQNIFELINYANGLTADADLDNIFIYRIDGGYVKATKIDDINILKTVTPSDQDKLFIRKFSFRDVEITGAILKPGIYKMSEGDSIKDLLEKSGGYTKNAYPFGAIYLNEDAKKINISASNVLYKKFLDNIVNVLESSSGAADFSSIIPLITEIKDSEPQGRIILDLEQDNLESIMVVDGDHLHIPEKKNNVFLFGEVSREGAVSYDKNLTGVDGYINQAAGLKKSADIEGIYVLYPNGVTKRIKYKRNLFVSAQDNITIYPGSVIYIPKKIDDSVSARLTAQAYATILGNIGITLASISSISNNN